MLGPSCTYRCSSVAARQRDTYPVVGGVAPLRWGPPVPVPAPPPPENNADLSQLHNKLTDLPYPIQRYPIKYLGHGTLFGVMLPTLPSYITEQIKQCVHGNVLQSINESDLLQTVLVTWYNLSTSLGCTATFHLFFVFSSYICYLVKAYFISHFHRKMS